MIECHSIGDYVCADIKRQLSSRTKTSRQEITQAETVGKHSRTQAPIVAGQVKSPHTTGCSCLVLAYFTNRTLLRASLCFRFPQFVRPHHVAGYYLLLTINNCRRSRSLRLVTYSSVHTRYVWISLAPSSTTLYKHATSR